MYVRLGQLEYFIKVAECGSITKAAKELYISQPSLTKSIANLEAEYDIQLLERVPKGVSLTPEGREFFDYAKDVVNSRQVLDEAFGKRAEKSPVHRLRVASQQLDFLYGLLDQLYMENGTVMNMYVEEAERGTVVERVYEGMSDIGILVLTQEDSRFFDMSLKKKSLEVHELDVSSVYVAMSSRSPLYDKSCITGAEARPYLHVALDMDDSMRRKIMQGADFNLDADQIIFCNTISTCLHFMRRQGAILYVPRWVLGLIEAESDIRAAPLLLDDGKPWPMVNRLCWIKRENEELPILGKRFIHLLTELFSQPQAT